MRGRRLGRGRWLGRGRRPLARSFGPLVFRTARKRKRTGSEARSWCGTQPRQLWVRSWLFVSLPRSASARPSSGWCSKVTMSSTASAEAIMERPGPARTRRQVGEGVGEGAGWVDEGGSGRGVRGGGGGGVRHAACGLRCMVGRRGQCVARTGDGALGGWGGMEGGRDGGGGTHGRRCIAGRGCASASSWRERRRRYKSSNRAAGRRRQRARSRRLQSRRRRRRRAGHGA